LAYTKMPFLQGFGDMQKQKVAERVVKLSHALREFEISDSLYSVTRCDCCDSAWLEDLDENTGNEGNTWKTKQQGCKCWCRNCGYRISHRRIHSENNQPVEHEQATCCNRCFKSMRSADEECPMIGKENMVYISPIPEELRNLTYAEEAAIARVSVMMNCKTLKGGVRSLKGNCSFLFQDQSAMLSVLPRIPSQTSIVLFKRTTSTATYQQSFPVRRNKIKRSLEFLIRYSPAYASVSIDQTQLDRWPENGFVAFKQILPLLVYFQGTATLER